MAKFQPLAGNTYVVMFQYDTAKHSPASAEFSENWSYGVKVDGSDEMLYWNLYDNRVVATIDQMKPIKGVPIQVIPKQALSAKNRPYNTYQFIKNNQSYFTEQTQVPVGNQAQPAVAQPQQAQQPTPQTATPIHTNQPKTPDPAEELDKRKRLMKWCVETIIDILPSEGQYVFGVDNIIPLVQSLHVEIRDKGIYPPDTTEIEKDVAELEKQFESTCEPPPKPRAPAGPDTTRQDTIGRIIEGEPTVYPVDKAIQSARVKYLGVKNINDESIPTEKLIDYLGHIVKKYQDKKEKKNADPPGPVTDKSLKKIEFLLDTKSFSSAKLASMATKVQTWLAGEGQSEEDALFHIGQMESLKDLK